MGFRCVVPGCKNTTTKRSLHKFPSNSIVFKQWVDAVCRPDLLRANRDNFRICENHFPDSMKVAKGKGKKLRSEAFPILNLPIKKLTIKLEDFFASDNIIVETEPDVETETALIDSDEEVEDFTSIYGCPEDSDEYISEVLETDEEFDSFCEDFEETELSEHCSEIEVKKEEKPSRAIVRLVILNQKNSLSENVSKELEKAIKQEKVIEIASDAEEDYTKTEIDDQMVELSDEEAEISSEESELASPAHVKTLKAAEESVKETVNAHSIQLNENLASTSSSSMQLDKELEMSDLLTVCRVCLKASKTVSLFTSYCDELNVAEMISTFTKEKIVQKDNRPQNICFNCINLAYQTHFFYTLWMNSQEKINRLLNIQPSKNVDKMIQTDFPVDSKPRRSSIDDVVDQSTMVCDETDELPIADTVSYYDSENNAIITYNNELAEENLANTDSDIIQMTWKCNLCQFDAGNDYNSLERHYYNNHAVKIHNNSTIASCCTCQLEFENLDALATHLQTEQHLNLCKQCFVCEARFPNTILLQKHLVEHRRNVSKDNGYACAICEIKFEDFDDILSHFDEYHADKSVCVICCRNIRLDVRFHMNSHRPNGLKYSCKSCLVYCANAETLDEHKSTRDHEKRELLICPICDRQFHRNSRLVKHINQHKPSYQAPFAQLDVKQDVTETKAEKLICSVCNKVFWKEKTFVLHCAKHENKNASICPVINCNVVFDVQEMLLEHMKLQHQHFSCKKCDKTFFSYDSVNQHLLIHDWENAPDPPNANCCKICSAVFSSVQKCQRHLEDEHKLFPCECGQVFADKRDFLKHNQDVHGENTPQNEVFQCHICEKQLQSKSTLKTHLNRHFNQVKKYECEVCHKLLSARASLEVHMRLHRGEKPYICRFCGIRFTALYTKNNHERRHTGDKPHACSVCGKRFIQPTDMRKHELLHFQRRTQKTSKRKRKQNILYEPDIVNLDDISIANHEELF